MRMKDETYRPPQSYPTVEIRPGSGLAPLLVGAMINGRYRVSDVLGRGGMGVVYRVEDTAHGNRVLALKVMNALTGDCHEQVKAEFRMMSRLRHPNVAAVYDIEPVVGTDTFLFTMEYVDGPTVADAARGMRWRDFLEHLVQVCRALSYVHSRRVIHFDLKPANVMVTKSGQVKVVDFGVALVRATNEPVPLRGTPQYMAPELIRGDWRIDHRVDIYSLGIMSYELLCGRLPFVADSLTELMICHQNQKIVFGGSVRVPEWLKNVVTRMAAKDPADRFPTANAVIEAVNRGGGLDFELETRETKESYIFSSRFVGRGLQLTRVRDYVASRAGGNCALPASLFVVGPGGVGKSRLLQEVRHFAQLARIRFVSGQCYEDALHVYEPIGTVTRVLASLAEAHELRDLLDAYGSDLAMVAAGSRDGDAEGGRGGADGAAAEDVSGDGSSLELDRLLGRIAEFMVLLSRTVPFVLCLDDMQWAREVVTRLVHHLVRRLKHSGTGGGARIAVLAACRDDEVEGSPTGRLMELLRSSGDLATVVLEPLGPDQVQLVIQSMLGVDTLPAPFVERVFRETDGTPFFIEEVMRALVESGAVRVRGGRWSAGENIGALEIPSGMAEVLARRLSFLDERSREVLIVMAVCGSPVPAVVLQRGAGLGAVELFNALGDLVRRRLAIQIVGDGVRYRVGHDRMRALLYGRLTDEERMSWHRAVGEALEAVAGDDERPVLELARHFFVAGDRDKALHYSVEGGKRAMAGFAFDLAIQLFGQARSLVLETGIASPSLQQIDEWLGDCHAIQGRHEESLACYHRASSAGDESGTATLDGARIRWKVGLVMMTRDDWHEAARESWAAIRALGGREPRTWLGFLAGTLVEGVRHLFHRVFPRLVRRWVTPAQRKRLQEMTAAYDRLVIAYAMLDPFRAGLVTLRASNLSDFLGPSTCACEAKSEMCILARVLFPRWATYRYGLQALEMARDLGSVWHEADAHRAIGVSASFAGHALDAANHFEEALGGFEQCRDFFWTSICHLLLFSSYYKLGRLHDALACLDRGRAVLRRVEGSHPYQRRLDAAACWLHAQMGNMVADDAVQRMREILPRHSEAGDMLFAAAATWMEGELLLRAGQHERAIEVLEQATAPGERRLAFEWDMPPYLYLARALIERLRLARARGLPLERATLRKIGRLVLLGLAMTKYRHRSSRSNALLCKAMLCWLRDDRTKAATFFARSRHVARAQGAALWLADAHYEEARCWIESGEAAGRTDVREGLRLALETYEQSGATLQADNARRLLNHIDPTPLPAAP